MGNKNNSRVIFSDKYAKKCVMKWLFREEDIEKYMKIILNKLGIFGNIDIYKCLDDGSLFLWVNDRNEYRVSISRDGDDPVIGFSKNDFYFWYQVVINGYKNIDLNMYKYGQSIENRNYTYEIGLDFVEYIVLDGEYTLEFKVGNSNELFYEDGVWKRFILNNHDKLLDYLVNVNFNNSIFDIYKNICEISLGSDVSKYSVIDLRLNKLLYDEEDNTIEDKTIGMIYLENGDLISLIVDNNGRQVWYDKCLNDTSYIYDDELMQVKYFICKRDGYINTDEKISLKDDNVLIDNCVDRIDTARDEVNNVKKLLKTMNFCNSRK